MKRLLSTALALQAAGVLSSSAFAAALRATPSGQARPAVLPAAPQLPGPAAPRAFEFEPAAGLPADAAPLGPLAGAEAALPALAPALLLQEASVAGASLRPAAPGPSDLHASLDEGPRTESLAPSASSDLGVGARRLADGRAGPPGAVLGALYHGSRSPGPSPDAVLASPDLSNDSASVGPAPSLDDLAAFAADPAAPETERREAVAALARLGGDGAKEALIRVGDANPEGGPSDYAVHRAALRALAESFGEVRSLRPVSRAHADKILSGLAGDKPALASFDYDKTLASFRENASLEIGGRMKAAADAGVRVAILSYRGDSPRWQGDPTFLDSLANLTPEQKASLVVAPNSGGRVYVFNARGVPSVLSESPAWTPAELASVAEAVAATQGRFGRGERRGASQVLGPYHVMAFLPDSTGSAVLESARIFLRAELSRRGIETDVIPGEAVGSAPVRLIFAKYDKRHGMALLRRPGLLDRLWALLRLGLSPSGWLGRLARRLPSRLTPPGRILVVGDQFFGDHATDARMAQGAPGALALAVGGSADPRIENVFVWPVRGAAASLEILEALARPGPK